MISYQPTPDFYNDYISHHGILNQKWGVKNGPPYPLDPIKKAKVYGKKDEIKGILNPKQVKTKKFHDDEVSIAWNEKNNVEEVEKRFYNDGTSDFFNPASIIKSFETDKGINPYDFKFYDRESFDYAAKNVNPGYGQRGTTNNCTRVAATMELRNKGYDVVAARSHVGASAFEYETWFNGAKTKGYSSSESMRRDLLKYGEGASGALNGYFGKGLGSGSGGHALHWEIKDRKVRIQDGQNGTIYDTFDEAWNHYGFNKGACFATRLDNCTPNWDAMIEDSVFGVDGNNHERKWRQNGKIYNNF